MGEWGVVRDGALSDGAVDCGVFASGGRAPGSAPGRSSGSTHSQQARNSGKNALGATGDDGTSSEDGFLGSRRVTKKFLQPARLSERIALAGQEMAGVGHFHLGPYIRVHILDGVTDNVHLVVRLAHASHGHLQVREVKMDGELGHVPVLIRHTLLDVMQRGRQVEGRARATRLEKLVGEPGHFALNKLLTKSFVEIVDFEMSFCHSKRSLLKPSNFGLTSYVKHCGLELVRGVCVNIIVAQKGFHHLVTPLAVFDRLIATRELDEHRDVISTPRSAREGRKVHGGLHLDEGDIDLPVEICRHIIGGIADRGGGFEDWQSLSSY